MTWFIGVAADFYDSGIQKLVSRLNKCLDTDGDWTLLVTVEKYSYVQAVHSQCHFCKLKTLYMFKTFVSLPSGHASYVALFCTVRMDVYYFVLNTCITVIGFFCQFSSDLPCVDNFTCRIHTFTDIQTCLHMNTCTLRGLNLCCVDLD